MHTWFSNTVRHTAVVAALASPLAVYAAPFTNGGFETPGVPVGANNSLSDGANPPPTGWTVGGTTTSFAIFYENNTFGVIGNSGPNAVGFGGNGTTGGILSQTFDTVAGQTYNVNYSVTSQQGVGATLQTASIQALNGATILGGVTESIPSLVAGENFHWFAGPTLTFVATGSSSTLRFTDTSSVAASACCNWALDAVSVNGQVAAIPEPDTYAFMLAGLGVLGFLARRKTNS